MRMTSALIEQLAAGLNVSSVLGFVPLPVSAVYASTKAAMYSYTCSCVTSARQERCRRQFARSWVYADLLDRENGPCAIPLSPLVTDTMAMLGTDDEEMRIEGLFLRNNPGEHEDVFVTQFNDMLLQR